MTWQEWRNNLYEKFSPSEEKYEKADEVFEKVSDYISEKYGLEAVLVGSASRRTSLRGDVDVDIFVLFDESVSETEFEKKGLQIGEEVLQELGSEKTVDYAEHPYVKGVIDGIDVDLVPAYDVEPDNISSSVDRSPHHSDWLEKNLDEDQRKDVVLLKQFLRANNLYGSSQKDLGFSGYLCEVLIANYGSLENLLGEARKWHQEQIIDVQKHYQDPEEALEEFENESFVVVDPVDPERNVASVLSEENLAEFVLRCIEFMEDPDQSFFEEERPTPSDDQLLNLINDRARVTVVEMVNPGLVDSKLWPQLRKLQRILRHRLEDSGFDVLSTGSYADSSVCRIYFECNTPERDFRESMGPKPTHGLDNVLNFIEEHPNYSLSGDRLVERSEREHCDPDSQLRAIRDNLTPERVGVPKDLREPFDEMEIVNPQSGSLDWRRYLFDRLQR